MEGIAREPEQLEPVFFLATNAGVGGDPHCGSGLNYNRIVGTLHADRSEPGGLAVCCLAGSLRFRRVTCRRRAVIWAPMDGHHAFYLAVRGAVRVLDLLPAPRTGTAGNHIAGRGNNDCCARTGRASRSGGVAKAAQPSHRHYPAKSGYRRHATRATGDTTRNACYAACGTRAGARGSRRSPPGAVGLQAAFIGVFTCAWKPSPRRGSRSA